MNIKTPNPKPKGETETLQVDKALGWCGRRALVGARSSLDTRELTLPKLEGPQGEDLRGNFLSGSRTHYLLYPSFYPVPPRLTPIQRPHDDTRAQRGLWASSLQPSRLVTKPGVEYGPPDCCVIFTGSVEKPFE